MGLPDPSLGKDWRGEKTDHYRYRIPRLLGTVQWGLSRGSGVHCNGYSAVSLFGARKDLS